METRCWRLALALTSIILMSSSFTIIDSVNPTQPLINSNYTISNQQPTLTIQSVNGATYIDNFPINGTIWDDAFPSELHWQLEESGEIIYQGSAINTLVENLSWQDPTTNSWSFSVEINATGLPPCACILTVVVIDVEQQVSQVHHLLFINPELNGLPPNLMITSPEMGINWRGDLNISGVAVSQIGYQPTLEWAAIQSNQANHFCVRGVLSDYLTIENWRNDGISYLDSETFNFQIQSSEYDDGWWLFVSRAGDNAGNFSSIACTAIALHNQRPIAALSGTSEVNESQLARFDASNSDDPVWGKDGLRFTFIVRRAGDSSPPLVHDAGTEKSWNWYANQSGHFDVMVRVTDTSGLSNSTNLSLIVNNLAPTAAASIEGITFSTEETIRLPNEPLWTIDASDSSDTENDVGGLNFVWFVDGEPVSLGREQIMRRDWIKDESKIHLITLSVTDDDGESDFIEVFVGIEGTQSDPLWDEPKSFTESMIYSVGGETNMMAIFMVMLVTISFITFRFTRGQKGGDIPKWVKLRTRENATIDEIDEQFENEDSD
ncbi:MAG TPA: hypothetical protein EYN30_03025 [Candidatus Poseidoniales archaeon]|nr:hypothetical protein [Candidatus Poseidoniales archaeon]HIO57635.1 hypothetical protein [Candidatus Poseidoniales archaeon]HIO86198.1 hypothetical protein [Candidatus Poseidoniales archaeon]